MPILFKIRDDHLTAMDRYMFKNFEKRTLKHIEKIFPEKYKSMGESETRKLIRKGYNTAFRYQIRKERNVTLFIDLMIGLSPDFDTREDLKWIREDLDDPEMDETSKIDKILYFVKFRVPKDQPEPVKNEFPDANR